MPWNQKTAITSALRKVWRTSDGYKAALAAAKESYTVTSKHGSAMRRVHFECKNCACFFSRDEVHVDHILPCVDPMHGWQGWDIFIKNLFDPDRLQILCTPCHAEKTKLEGSLRAAIRKTLKADTSPKKTKKRAKEI
jgi:5-methylcytosine-specific restriction endonuclease McrA